MSVPSLSRLVGRRAERDEIGVRMSLAAKGVGGLLRLRGEAGIGKTVLAEEAAVDAKRLGFDTAWSGCWQTAAVPALYPWTQVVGQLAEAGIVSPDLETGLADVDAARIEQARRVELWLRRRAQGPVLIVLDDLHWADAATLAVLEHLAPILASLPVLIIGVHRPATASASSAFRAFDTASRRHSRLVELGVFDRSETAELMSAVTGEPVDTRAAQWLTEITGGNPLFIRELGRVLPSGVVEVGTDLDGIALPRSLRSVVTERVSATSDRCRGLIKILSVAGDEVPVELAAAISGIGGDELADVVDEAIDAGLVHTRGVVVSFRHALLRAAVYESLSSADRARLHDRIGHQLLARRKTGHPVGAAALAHHFGRAAPLGNAARVFEFAVEAAGDAGKMLSFDLAARRYEQALAMLALDPGLGDQARLLLELADAQVASGEVELARKTFRRAAEAAAGTDDVAALGRAALGYSGGIGGIEVVLGDLKVMALLEDAANGLVDDDVLGPRVLARLSIALSYRAPLAERARLVSQARHRAIAGGDPSTIAEVLAAWCDVMAGPAHVAERLAVAGEIVELTVGRGDLRGEALGRRLLVEALFEAGDLRTADRQVKEFERAARRLGRAEYLWYPALWRGALAFARAQQGAHATSRQELEALVAGSGGTNADLLAKVQLVSMSFDLADPDPAQHLVEEILDGGQVIDDTSPLVTATLIRTLAGDLEAAAAVVDRCIELALAAELDSEWPGVMLQLTEVVAALGGHHRAADLRRAIEPYGSVWVIEGIGAGVRGPLHRALGLLAALDGDLDAADAHFSSARDTAVQAGADLVAGLADHDGGRLLHDPERMARAERLWRRIGASHRLAQLEAVSAPPVSGPARPTATAAGRNHFTCDGDVWSITFDGATCTLSDRKGLRDLARLLADPGREIAAIDLAAAGESLVERDTGEAIDKQARDAYRARLTEIDAELDEADAHGDIERSARLAAERDALVEQLTGAYGLGGRARRTGGSAERARTAVRSRIRGALDRINEAHPALGRHLERSVRTGTFCVYNPDPLLNWEVSHPSHTV